MNMTEYAKSLVKQYDKNGDNMLQPEEQKELRGRAAESDLNHDGVITIDELVAHLSSNTPATASTTASSSVTASTSSSGSDSGHHHHDGDDRGKSEADASKRVLTGTAGGLAAATKEGDKRHSYRFSTAADKLPSGLPSWFKSKDTNGDGQIEMSEYSRSWSNSTAAEFQRYDLDGDGVITAKEAATKPAPKGE
jgi:Ca2+-binding EF-hand superfamily protein